jgi:hypothetical protein
MSNERFEGAITRPAEPSEGTATIVPAPVRPPRPWLIELAAALLIVGGLSGIATAPSPLVPDAGLVPWLFLGLAGLTVVVGILVRAGRAWPLALNVTAIALFLEVLALPSPIAVVFLVFDVIVFLALVRHRWWFDWSADDPAADDGTAR